MSSKVHTGPIVQAVLNEPDIPEIRNEKLLKFWATSDGTVKIKTDKKVYTVGQLSMLANGKEFVLNPNEIVSYANSSTVEVQVNEVIVAGETRKVIQFEAVIPGLLDNGLNWVDRF